MRNRYAVTTTVADSRDALARGVPDFAAVIASMTDPTWFLLEDNFEAALEHELESRFSVGNGFVGIRGSLDLPTEASRPRTYVAGLFEVKPGPAAVSALVPAPQAFALSIAAAGEDLDIGQGEVLEHKRLLDYRSGVLHSVWRQRLPSGRDVTLESLRFASRAAPALAVQLLRLRFGDAVEVRVEAVEPPSPGLAPTADASVWQTETRSLAIACLRVLRARSDLARPSGWRLLDGRSEMTTTASELSVLQIGGFGLDRDPRTARSRALKAVTGAKRQGLPGLYKRQTESWGRRWRDSDVSLEGDEAAQAALRFAIYHLNSAVDPANDKASVAARGLTGDGYLGHVFWDTEVFILPFFTFTWPEAARALLEYRHKTLPAARAKAKRFGFDGALYAWESTDTGEEATPPYAIGPTGEVVAIRNGDLEQHVSAAVAYAVWQYWQATGDIGFLASAGAEIILETARFWASRAGIESDHQYHIRNVIGPDEYHEGVDDNAYTNWMARWNIERGLEVATLLHRRRPEHWRRLAEALDLDSAELSTWKAVARSIYAGVHAPGDLIEQFSGFFDLERIDLSAFRERTAPMDVLLGTERSRRSQVIKQADVLMLLALLPDRFSREVQQRNFEFYEPRCGHGSSLSPPVHSLLAARLGLLDVAKRYFDETAAIDLSDSMGNAAGGIHMGAQGGLWQAAVFGFGGVMPRPDGLGFSPNLPSGWRHLRFPLRWRGRRLAVQASQERGELEVTLQQGRPMTVYAGGRAHRLENGRPVIAPLNIGAEGR